MGLEFYFQHGKQLPPAKQDVQLAARARGPGNIASSKQAANSTSPISWQPSDWRSCASATVSTKCAARSRGETQFVPLESLPTTAIANSAELKTGTGIKNAPNPLARSRLSGHPQGDARINDVQVIALYQSWHVEER